MSVLLSLPSLLSLLSLPASQPARKPARFLHRWSCVVRPAARPAARCRPAVPSTWARVLPPPPPCSELQLMIDVLTSRGAPGHAPPPGTPPVEVYFSNPDLLWANEFPTPRFGQVGGRQRDRGEGGGQGGGGGGEAA